MEWVTLIYFSSLLIFLILKRGADVSTYITFLYVLVSIFSIIAKNNNLINPNYATPSFFSTIAYCLLLGAIIIPTYKYNYKSIKNIYITHHKELDIFVYISFFSFLFTLIVYLPDIVFKLTYGDFLELRQLELNEESYSIVHLSGLLRTISIFTGIIGSVSFLMIPIFFISLIYLKKKWWYSLMALLSSTIVILEGIMNIDRSSTFKWLIFLGLNIVFFWPLLQIRLKRIITPLLSIVIISAISYFVAVSNSRFEDSDDGVNKSIVRYAGQSYYNFCYLFDNFNNGEGFTTKYLLPATHHWILKNYDGNVPRQQELTTKTGIECGVFYTVLGTFVLDANQIGPFIFVVIYSILFSKTVKYKKRDGCISLYGFICNYVLLLIPTFGIIAYMYVGFYTNLVLFVAMIIHNIFLTPKKIK